MNSFDKSFQKAFAYVSRRPRRVLGYRTTPVEDEVTNADEIAGVVRDEMPNIIHRVRKAGARGPLTYIGAGMTSVVLQSKDGCWKVARQANSHLRAMLQDEYDWLKAAYATRGVRQYVVRARRFHPGPIVIERDCVSGKRGGWADESKLFDLHQKIQKLMLPRGWTSPEFKGDSYIMTAKGPVIVDGGMAIRVGNNLVEYVEDVLAGRKKLRHGDKLADLAFYIRREIGQTLTEAEAMPLLGRLPKV